MSAVKPRAACNYVVRPDFNEVVADTAGGCFFSRGLELMKIELYKHKKKKKAEERK